MLVAIHVGVALSCILIMPMSLGGHMAGALDTSSDSHIAPPPRMSTSSTFPCQGGEPCMSGPMLVAIHVGVVFSCILIMPGETARSRNKRPSRPTQAQEPVRSHDLYMRGGSIATTQVR